jgi:hypothetical protein
MKVSTLQQNCCASPAAAPTNHCYRHCCTVRVEHHQRCLPAENCKTATVPLSKLRPGLEYDVSIPKPCWKQRSLDTTCEAISAHLVGVQRTML